VPSTLAQLTLAPEGGSLVLYWTGADFTLQSATNLIGPYATASFQNNPSRISPTNAQEYFELKQ
jgi:hypothetical protein